MAAKQRTKVPAKTAQRSSTTAAAPPARTPPSDAIAVRAFELWRQSGGAHGNDQAHWFQAEQELRGRTMPS